MTFLPSPLFYPFACPHYNLAGTTSYLCLFNPTSNPSPKERAKAKAYFYKDTVGYQYYKSFLCQWRKTKVCSLSGLVAKRHYIYVLIIRLFYQ